VQRAAPAARPAPRSEPGKPTTVSGTLVPAPNRVMPQVVAPLPKALEGKNRPDENLATDRGTRTRRASLFVVLIPVLAFLGLAVFVGLTIWKDQREEEAAESERNNPQNLEAGSDREHKELKAVVPLEADSERKDEDEPAALPAVKPSAPAPAAAPPRARKATPASNCIDKARARYRVVQVKMEQRFANEIDMKLRGLEDNLENLQSGNERALLQQCNALRERLDRVR
jgi:hypothetical protein